jgi:hypothetical protein
MTPEEIARLEELTEKCLTKAGKPRKGAKKKDLAEVKALMRRYEDQHTMEAKTVTNVHKETVLNVKGRQIVKRV